jgi:RNA polymerase sigma-70 factor (ECF subfamily)
LQSARVRREQYVGSWLPEPLMAGLATAPALLSPTDDSLSMAFLLVLERLSPVERAVFLLREVFDYEYAEIAGIIGHKEAACRQILRRARQHITRNRPRFHSSPHEQEKLLQRFQDASARGDMEGLIALLADDVVLYADGGGKAPAVPRPVLGAANVARLILRAPAKLLPRGLVRRLCSINGMPAVVSYLKGRPYSVFTIEIAEEKVRNIYIISNPNKLSGLPPLPAPPS